MIQNPYLQSIVGLQPQDRDLINNVKPISLDFEVSNFANFKNPA